MEHFYQNIEGWFSYEYIYKDVVDQAEDSSLFVEIGSYKGRSAAFMAVEIINSGKKIDFHCVDPMMLMSHYVAMPDNEKAGYGAEEFHRRLEPVKGHYTLHQMTSDDAVKLYQDGSIDFLMIDGDHSYEGVCKDIKNWIPKMRPGGLIAGDDVFLDEIYKAVIDTAGHLNPTINGIHFFIQIPE